MVAYHAGKMVEYPNTMGQNEVFGIIDKLIMENVIFNVATITATNDRAIVSVHDGTVKEYARC